ncbi:hypothetical protein PBCVNEJV1_519R [Paramecium bursaria Chlorella virus NE-JV-1]|nr:hypothetical protein PBCVNEJV1_519R [Paramecium bursaria Chlorella virus NE-JV-1]
MSIVTIESMCASHENSLRKMLVSRRGIFLYEMSVDYDDATSIFAAISSFFSSVKTMTDGAHVFPISLLKLARSEYFAIAMDLIEVLKLNERDQTIVCIDGDPNDALAEQFESERVFMTLDEIREVRNIVNSSTSDGRAFGKNIKFIHVMPDSMHDALCHI